MIDPKFLQDAVELGWKCLNCGERVPNSCKWLDEKKIVFSGLCRSDTCRKLPPGGNPFEVVIS